MWKSALTDWPRVSEKIMAIYALAICRGNDKLAPLLLHHDPL